MINNIYIYCAFDIIPYGCYTWCYSYDCVCSVHRSTLYVHIARTAIYLGQIFTKPRTRARASFFGSHEPTNKQTQNDEREEKHK